MQLLREIQRIENDYESQIRTKVRELQSKLEQDTFEDTKHTEEDEDYYDYE